MTSVEPLGIPDAARLPDERIAEAYALDPGPAIKRVARAAEDNLWTYTRAEVKAAKDEIRFEKFIATSEMEDNMELTDKVARLQEQLAEEHREVVKLGVLNNHNQFAIEQRDALIAGFQKIRGDYGHVCENFLECAHLSCRDSYAAWAEADEQLAGIAKARTYE